MIIDKYCYSLLELAERWGCTDNDILHLAAQEKIRLSVNLGGYGHEALGNVPIVGWYEILLPSEISSFFPDHEMGYFSLFRIPEKDIFIKVLRVEGPRAIFAINRTQVFVMAKEVARVEKECPEVISHSQTEQQVSIKYPEQSALLSGSSVGNNDKSFSPPERGDRGKKIYGMDAIAKRYGMSESTTKIHAKRLKPCPIHNIGKPGKNWAYEKDIDELSERIEKQRANKNRRTTE